MSGMAPVVAAPGEPDAIEYLPACYGEIVHGVMEAQRMLALSAIAADAEAYYLVRSTQVTSRAYISVTQDQRIFFFFHRPSTEDVVLEMDTGFSVTPLMRRPRGDIVDRPIEITEASTIVAVQPPFFGDDIPSRNKTLLAAALGEGQLDKIAFIDLGLFFLGVTRPDDILRARVAYMWHADAKARIIFPTSPPGAARLSYEPEPFRMLLDEVANWAKSGFKTGEPWPIHLGRQSDEAIPQILETLVSGWNAARRATLHPADDPLWELVPDLEILHYRAAITLRLQPDGRLAVKPDDDDFRLEMAVEEREGRMTLSVGPPDFLVSGTLRDQIMTEVLTAKIIRRWAESAGLGNTLGFFETFLRAAAPQALIFRGEKQGFTDTEIFVFEGDWAGNTRQVIAAVELKVRKIGDDFEVKADEDTAEVIHLTGAPAGFVHGLAFPKFLLSLVNQLRNWENAFE